MAVPQLDTLDTQLVDMLGRDARVSNRRIAAELGVTEGTVRGRIKRLQQDGLIAFTAITGFQIEQRARLAFINIQAEVDRVREVAATIRDIPEVNAVLITMGHFNITAMCLIDDLDALVEVASDRILALNGVRHVETSIAVRTVKYNDRMAKITKPAVIFEDD
ncbi:Lrp/AsnC family transcriptional regulator [Novosphingobium sp. SL115]|uniref:Lrp/AsnC family transcriptional regulator n=1 Tax=Novosphingobium sp. SL115 TaxID=2995150 RepID=UPI002277037E|nr:Lrp/AsnC family transcriptional regulator [Novosphingobium sp. SL115]MCY1672808.1 Lrp/AsnC family transcriptional regulator [Novosphingobium sp. SL115]